MCHQLNRPSTTAKGTLALLLIATRGSQEMGPPLMMTSVLDLSPTAPVPHPPEDPRSFLTLVR